MYIELTEEEWWNKFKPIKNHLDDNASFDGRVFGTFGEEMLYARENTDSHTVWTFGDDGEGGLFIVEGYIYVNRLGYFVTEVPYDPKNQYYIDLGGFGDDEEIE